MEADYRNLTKRYNKLRLLLCMVSMVSFGAFGTSGATYCSSLAAWGFGVCVRTRLKTFWALQAAEKPKLLKGTAFRPYVTNLESVRL